jgi:hypothetical protein
MILTSSRTAFCEVELRLTSTSFIGKKGSESRIKTGASPFLHPFLRFVRNVEAQHTETKWKSLKVLQYLSKKGVRCTRFKTGASPFKQNDMTPSSEPLNGLIELIELK